MHKITCPHCHTAFAVNDTEFNAILNQVRNETFEKELEQRLKERERALRSELSVSAMKEQQSISDEFEQRLQSLAKQLADSEKKSAGLEAQLASVNEKHASELQLLKMQEADKTKQLLSDTQEKHLAEIHTLQEEVAHYKDFKARSSTKMVGESLEQHCMDEFDKLRATAFAGDYFEKDNEISETGSKGDFIYRAYDDAGNELVSIMFEMKNEMETTVSSQRHKNADFFKELDKDRREKNCEYAVLCSLLESDSELYNQGIVDVSHRYPKMYVVRPQFFIVIISLLRNAAKSQIALKQELAAARQSNVDIINLEQQVELFKTNFGKNYDLASRKFDETVSEIDKAILHLQKTKDALTSCSRNLRLANDKSSALTVRKLLKDSPGLLEQYHE